LEHYLRSLELDESNIDAYVCLGGVLENMKAPPEKAEKYYRLALDREPGNQRAIEAIKKLKAQAKKN
jgi:tetratricopeptide (TPR) repeat protein